MADNWYYDFMNLDNKMSRDLLKNAPYADLRFIKDMMNTKTEMFQYDGIENNPIFPHLTSEIIERALLFMNSLCFYYIPHLGGYYLCRFVWGGDRNEYWKPTFVNLLTLSGYQLIDNVPYDDIILVKDNRMDIIPYLVIQQYIDKIKFIEDAMLKVITISTLPLAIVGNKKQANALKSVAGRLGYKDPFIVADETIIDEIKQFNIDVPISPNDIYMIKDKYKNECLESIGIYNTSSTKSERMLADEVSSINDFADTIYRGMVNERKRFCKQVSKASGSTITLIESYKETIEDDRKNEADLQKDVMEAKAEAIKEIDPDADFSQSNPVKVGSGGSKV